MTGKRSGRKSSDRGPGHRGRASLVTRLARAAALLALLLALGLGAVVLAFGQDLPDTSRLAERGRRPSVTLVAADGTPITTIGGFYGEAVDIRDLPPYLPKAVLATEDRRFYDHFGFDPVAIGRAVVANVRAGRIVQGGSTITQQLAKNLFLTPERTIRRKVQETLLAFWLESRFDKDEILAIYLNRMYFGAGTYGIDAAAQRYFGKPAKSLGLHESALLAGLLKAPSRYNPGRAGSPSVERAQQVLDNMVAAGYLSPEQGQAAKRRPSRPRPLVASRGAQYFVDWAFDQVSGFVGYPDRDIVVRTTLDMGLQRVAEAKIEAALAADGASAGASQAALVLTAPDGAVRAMVGGRDYAASQFNRATQALRQPGSAFKLFVYLAALEQGLRPSDRFVDSPISIGGWRPKNFDGGYAGEVSMTEAFARSINTVAAQVGERMGRRRIEAMARRLGITSELHMDATIALGTSEVTLLELTQSYATVANGGTGVWTYGIDEIRTRQGQILYRRQAAGPGRVLAPEVVAAMNEMLAAVLTQGTGRAAAPGRPAAGKTGTSESFRDAWFVGYTADLVAGVWIGNDDNSAMKSVTGGGLAAKLWRSFMVAAHGDEAPRPLLPNLASQAPAGASAVSSSVPAAGAAEPKILSR